MGKRKVFNAVKDYISDRTGEGLDFLETIKPPKAEMERRMFEASKEAEKRLGLPHPNTPQQRIDAMNVDTNLWHGTPNKDNFIIPGLEKTIEQVGDNITTKIKWKQPKAGQKLVQLPSSHTGGWWYEKNVDDLSLHLSPQENFASVFTNDIKGINPGGGVNDVLPDIIEWNQKSKSLPVQSALDNQGMILPLAGKIGDNVFDYTTHKGQQTIDEFLASLPNERVQMNLQEYSKRQADQLRTGDFRALEQDDFLNYIDKDFIPENANIPNTNAEFYVSEIPYNDLRGERLYNELSGLTKPGKLSPDAIDKNVRLKFGNVRARDAAFNPKYLGIGPGSILATDLFAGENPNMDNSIRKNLVKTLNNRKIKDDIEQYGALKVPERNNFIGELADGMKRFTSLDRDPTGASNMFFGGGAKALDDLSYGMTPMQQMPGRVPAIPTNEAMMNFLELVGF